MNNNEKSHEWIDRFNDNELNGDELKEFLERLKDDPVLRAEVRLDRELNEMIQDEGVLSLRKKIINLRKKEEGRGRNNMIILLAASILIIMVLSVLLYLVAGLNSKKDKSLQTDNKPANEFPINKSTSPGLNAGKNIPGKESFINDTLSKNTPELSNKQNQTLVAANYKPFPPFESLIGNHLRSEYFKLAEPLQGSYFRTKGPIRFSWETDISHPLILVIMDNHGQRVYESHILHEKSLKVPAEKLDNGLFYFKILKEGEILFFGKFSIEIK
jgi:hypothetical protein